MEEHGIRSNHDRLKGGTTIWDELRERYDYETGLFTYNGLLLSGDYGLIRGFDTTPRFPFLQFEEGADPRDAGVINQGTSGYVEYLKQCLSHEYSFRSLYNGVDLKLVKGLLRSYDKSEATADVYAERFLSWQADQDGPWAACVNFMDAHFPYEIEPEHRFRDVEEAERIQRESDHLVFEFYGGQRPWSQRAELEKLYDCSLRQIDAAVQKIVETLERRGELENTLLVVTSDHGEGFGERSRVEPGLRVAAHKVGIHESLLHVPLLVKYPGQDDADSVDHLATTTRFPHAVRQVLEGEWSGDEFAQEQVIASSRSPRGEAEIERAKVYCDDTEFLHGYRRAVYQEDGERIVKHMVSNSDACAEPHAISLDLTDGATELSVDTHDIVDEVYSEQTTSDVQSDSGGWEMNAEAERRLEELGYI